MPYQNQPAFVNPNSVQPYANLLISPPRFNNDQKLSNLEKALTILIQMTSQMMNENRHTHQAMNRLELQVSQMASQMGEREKRIFPKRK